MRASIILFLVALITNTAMASQIPLPKKYNEAELKKSYESALSDLDYLTIVAEYPKAIKDLLSGNSEKQSAALRILGATEDLRVIPWLVQFLNSEDNTVRTWAGSSVEKVIAASALKYRDPTQHDQIILRPPPAYEVYLRNFAWIALKMFHRTDDPNIQAYAITITRYINATELEDELQACLVSRHPAVSENSRWALRSLGLEVKNPGSVIEPNE